MGTTTSLVWGTTFVEWRVVTGPVLGGAEGGLVIATESADEGFRARVIEPAGLPLYGIGISHRDALKDLIVAVIETREYLQNNESRLAPRKQKQLQLLNSVFQTAETRRWPSEEAGSNRWTFHDTNPHVSAAQ